MTEAGNGVGMKHRVGKQGRDGDRMSGSRALGRDVRESQGQEFQVSGRRLGDQGRSEGLDAHPETPKEMPRSSWQT